MRGWRVRAVLVASAGCMGACQDNAGPFLGSVSARAEWTGAQVTPRSFSVRVVSPRALEVTGAVAGSCLVPRGLSATATPVGTGVAVALRADVSNCVVDIETALQYRAVVELREGVALPATISLVHTAERGVIVPTDTVLVVPRS